MEYSKLGIKDYKYKEEEIDLNILVRNITAEHFEDFEVRGIEIEVQIPNRPILFKGDKKELKRAIENLVINSYTHNKKGNKVKVKVYSKDKKSFISVADNGEDISKDMEIFKSFVTSNKNRIAGKGTGMGLLISKRIIERFGGIINLRKSQGEYTKEFLIIL